MKKSRLIALTGIVSMAGVLLWLFTSPVTHGTGQDEFQFKIIPGMSFNSIMAGLVEKGIISETTKPRLVARIIGTGSGLKVGKYKITGGLSSYQLIKLLSEGRSVNERITIPEGLQSRQIASILAKGVEIDSIAFMQHVQDTSLLREFGLSGDCLEGYLFPNTYDFQFGKSAKSVVRTMLKEFNRQVGDSLRTVINSGKMTLLETLTLASIIEGEAVVDSERALISAVYHNRLRRGIPLQADPTIQYIIKDGPRRLLTKDLRIDSPYNTYLNRGLPPGPINNPGLASVVAAIQPDNAPFLYFVANGDGTHTFSRTLREHNRAKARFDKYRRKIRGSKQKKRK